MRFLHHSDVQGPFSSPHPVRIEDTIAIATLDAFEDRHDTARIPSLVSPSRPAVIVRCAASNINGAIDAARASHHAPGLPWLMLFIPGRIGRRLIAPVEALHI